MRAKQTTEQLVPSSDSLQATFSQRISLSVLTSSILLSSANKTVSICVSFVNIGYALQQERSNVFCLNVCNLN